MATIDKQANGSVKIVRNSQIVYLNNLDNVTVTTEGSTDGNPIVIIAYEGGQQVFSIAEITSINGSPKPATVADTVELLALEVFKFGGGSGIGATGNSADTFAVLNSNVWNRSLYTTVEMVLSEDRTLSITNDTAPFSYGIMYLTTNGHTLTLPGVSTGVIFNTSAETTLVYNKRNGIYRWSSDGKVDEEAPVVSNSLPIITVQPTTQTLTVGNPLLLTVDYTGTPTPTVQWQGSGDDINFNDLVGATSKSLSKTAADDDDGYYRAKVTNSEGVVYSNSAQITVNVAVDPGAASFLTVASASPAIDVSGAPEFYKPLSNTTEDISLPIMFAEHIPANQDGYFQVSVSAITAGINTLQCFFGISETGVVTDPANATADMKIGFISQNGGLEIRVKDNDVFFGGDDTVTKGRVVNIGDATRFRFRRTGNTYTMEKSTDFGSTFQVLYTFQNYHYTGDLYALGALLQDPAASLSYVQGGGIV